MHSGCSRFEISPGMLRIYEPMYFVSRSSKVTGTFTPSPCSSAINGPEIKLNYSLIIFFEMLDFFQWLIEMNSIRSFLTSCKKLYTLHIDAVYLILLLLIFNILIF